MPAIESLQATNPRTLSRLSVEQKNVLTDALETGKKGHFGKAAKRFETLADSMRNSEPDVAKDAASMRANSALFMAKMNIRRERELAEKQLSKALELLEDAHDPDPYWADYVFLAQNIRTVLHREFGCRITRHRGVWEVKCVAVSNALHIPGISRSETFDLECSICGRDPMFCPHKPGEVYDGRLALGVIKNLKFDHIALMINQLPEERDVGMLPRPLRDDDIRDFFPKGKATQILSKGELRCKDLIRVIHQDHRGGMNFVRRSPGRYARRS